MRVRTQAKGNNRNRGPNARLRFHARSGFSGHRRRDPARRLRLACRRSATPCVDSYRGGRADLADFLLLPLQVDLFRGRQRSDRPQRHPPSLLHDGAGWRPQDHQCISLGGRPAARKVARQSEPHRSARHLVHGPAFSDPRQRHDRHLRLSDGLGYGATAQDQQLGLPAADGDGRQHWRNRDPHRRSTQRPDRRRSSHRPQLHRLHLSPSGTLSVHDDRAGLVQSDATIPPTSDPPPT